MRMVRKCYDSSIKDTNVHVKAQSGQTDDVCGAYDQQGNSLGYSLIS